VLASLTHSAPCPAALAALDDDQVLAAMNNRIISASFVWSLIEAKWPSTAASARSWLAGRRQIGRIALMAARAARLGGAMA
jgi:hypothetical protein